MNDFRQIALALPLAIEADHFGAPSFRVNGKIFAQLSQDGLVGLVKLPLERQAWARATYPQACEAEPQWGRHGWTRLRWRDVPEEKVADLLQDSWRAITPRKLHGLLIERPPA